MFKSKLRPRRLRRLNAVREMLREVRLTPHDFVMPLFVVEGSGVRRPISTLPGHFQFSIDQLVLEVGEVVGANIPAVILFGIPENKDATGSATCREDSLISRAVKTLKDKYPNLCVITDECFCEYTDHGHCGIIKDGDVDNDSTLAILAKQAVCHAHAGADIVAPSGMMDGMVGALRAALDETSSSHVAIMSYAVKQASSFYGPFREAVNSRPQFGDRTTYQMDPANRREAMKEARLDAEEGADILLVKPALPCLDIIADVRKAFDLPIAAYQVSGEYAMIVAAADRDWLDGKKAMLESLTAIKRAGSDIIVTYFAKEAARILD